MGENKKKKKKNEMEKKRKINLKTTRRVSLVTLVSVCEYDTRSREESTYSLEIRNVA